MNDFTSMKITSHIVFVWPHMEKVGGIQTLIIEACEEIERNGGKSSIVCDIGEFAKRAPSSTNLIDLAGSYKPDDTGLFCASNAKDNFLFIAFNATSCAIAVSLLRAAKKNNIRCSMLLGIYHPRALVPEYGFVQKFIARRIALSVGSAATYFMNDDCRSSHEINISQNYRRSSIILLPVLAKEKVLKSSRSCQLKICSVGRITPFKSYNFYSHNVCSSLAKKGIDISWDIYGWGEDEGRLKKQLESSPFVNFCGSLPIELFESTVSKYDLFVGMGMSAIKSSLAGIPTILAVDNATDRCLGFSFEAPRGNVGEAPKDTKLNSLEDIIFNFSRQSDLQRELVSTKCAEWASQFSFKKFFLEIERIASESMIKRPTEIYIWSTAQILALRLKSFIRKAVKLV